jgi:hypothetical protein
MKRVCFRCDKVYRDDRSSPFRTCHDCRVAVVDDGGGCHHWDRVGDNPNVYKQRDVVAIDSAGLFDTNGCMRV